MVSSNTLCAFLFLLAIVPQYESLKILMYSPRFGHSHVIFVGKLADQLAEAGHEIVLYQPILTPEIATLIGAKNVRAIERKPNKELPKMANMDEKTWDPETASLSNAVQMLGMLGKMFRASCEESLADTKMMERLKAENFDLGISEFFDVCGFGIFKHIGVEKTIVLYSSGMPLDDATFFGLPASSSFVYDFVSRESIEGFVGRMKNFIGLFVGRHFLMKKFVGETAEAFKIFNKNLDYRDLVANSSYAFVNMAPFVDFPRPITHKFIDISGVGMQKALKNTGKMEQKYQQIFDSAKKGVIFFSLGSVAKSYSMPNETKKEVLSAFSEFKDINFLWKYEKPEHNVAAGYNNVYTGSWLPQKEIMGHPKLLAFITHGGANSITEATYAGVPLLTIPLFGDQNRNALMLEQRGIGLHLEKTELQKDKIVAAIRKIVYEPTYKRNAQELSQIIRNQPMGPDERFVKHVEFAAKYDIHRSLDMTAARKLSTIEYYNLDIVAVLLSIVTLVLTILYLILRCVARRVFGAGTKKTKKID